MSSLTRRIQKTGKKVGVHNEVEGRSSRRRGARRGTSKRPHSAPIVNASGLKPLTPEQRRPHAKAARAGRTGVKSKPSPELPQGWSSFRLFKRSKNSDPAYRKSIWPAAKIEARRKASTL